MGIIHILNTNVANQIAAGEVIERPSSAVKELLENALDACAHTITVEIENGGIDLIRITDDGEGFYKEDLLLATHRHATSKIKDFNDVYHLDTFGFRGEALASIAVISRLRITSGRSETETSYTFSTDANARQVLMPAAPRKGTCIEVRDLYYNVPARKKFMKSNSHENALIYELICKFAFGFPDVNFTYLNDGEVVFSSNKLDTVDDLMQYIYGNVGESEVIHIKANNFYQKQVVEAWFYPMSVTRKNRNHMTYFVNDRLIDSKDMDHIIDEATYTLMPKGRFPVCVLKLQLPAFNIDVNIHPSKRFIKFKNLEEWRGSLVSLLKEELWLSRLNVPFSIKTQDEVKEESSKISAKPQTIDFCENVAEEEKPILLENRNQKKKDISDLLTSCIAEPLATYVSQVSVPIKSSMEDCFSTEKVISEKDNLISDDSDIGLSRSELLDLEYIGQLNQTFILAQDRENLYIIDQHTLHERILYEHFMKSVSSETVTRQQLLHSARVKITPLQEDALVKNIFLFDKLGFTVENKGSLTYELTAVPTLLSKHSNLSLFFSDMLDDLQSEMDLNSLASVDEERIIMAACKGAVKAHYKLSESEVRYLLKELSHLDNPHTCPHGRPIIMNISMNELYLFFKRGSF